MNANTPSAKGQAAPKPDRSVVQRTAHGILYSAGGQILLALVSWFGGIFLSRLLSVEDFGIYAICSFVVLRLSALSDLGLNTKLIYDTNDPSTSQQRSVFSLHLLVSVAFYGIFYAITPVLSVVLGIGRDANAFCRLLGLIILFQPLQTLPVALLSRCLRYDLLTSTEVAGGIAYQIAAVILASRGFSFWSFGYAALLSTVVRTMMLFAYSPWRPGVAWDSAYLSRCVRFGGAFQLSGLTAAFRDNLVTLIGGPFFGPSAVGLLNWSLRLAWVCTQTYTAVCTRVAFPSLSRMRSDPALFGAALTKMLRYVNLATLLTLSIVAALLPELIYLVFTDKWLPAVPLFYCFAMRMVASNYTTLLDFGLKAQGYPERSLKILTLWTIWEFAFALAGLKLGYQWIAVSSAVAIWGAFVWLYRELNFLTPVRIWSASRSSVIAAAVTFVALHFGKAERVNSLAQFAVAGILGGIIYIGTVLAVDGREVWGEIRNDLSVLLSRPNTRATEARMEAVRPPEDRCEFYSLRG
ncbi:MAG: oligosaccharide flippase family protein [Acidobacteriia bacterium]|nr:oligosaccharide flippase family protein [Terriglobia bacterium]